MVRTLRIFLSSTLRAEGDIESDNWNGFEENLCPTSTRPNQGNRGMVARVNNMAVCD